MAGRKSAAGKFRPMMLSLVVLMGLVLAVAQAEADDPPAPTPITAGAGLYWGIKQSFRNYIEGPIAGGAIALSEGATRNPDGTFHFPVASGSYGPVIQATTVQFSGRVEMEGHHGALRMNVSNPKVELTPLHTQVTADVTSLPPDGGPPIVAPDVVFATLDLSGAVPTIDAEAGTTAWPPISSFLARGAVDAFAGRYSVGTGLDPVSFSYFGPGGKPVPPLESWTAPGTPKFAVIAETQLAGMGVGALQVDAANGVVHAVGRLTSGGSPTGYRALDLTTLAIEASLDDPGQTWTGAGQMVNTRRVAFANGALYAAGIPGPVRRTRLLDGVYVQDAPIGAATPGPPMQMALAPDLSRIYLAGSGIPGWAQTLNWTGGEWVQLSHALDASGGSTTDLVVDPDGEVVETHATGEPHVRPIVTLAFDIEPIGRADIPGTLLAGGEGFNQLALAPGGTVYAAERENPAVRILKLVKGPSGYAVAGAPLDTGARIRRIAVDPGDGTLYAGGQAPAAKNPLLVIRDGEIVATLTFPSSVDQISAWNGTAYVSNQTGAVWAVRQVGTSPAIAADPVDATVNLDRGEESEGVAFTASATGTPAPALQWQAKPAGATLFADIEAETAATLEVEAAPADHGTQYRAVFSNYAQAQGEAVEVGTLASDAATLTVNTAPEVLVEPEDVAVIEREDALLKVLPTGSPLPRVTWQRRVAGFWESIDPDSGDFELDGGSLVVREANIEMSGAIFRAKLTNAVSTAFSRPANLTVSPAPPEQVEFGSGHLDWGVKASFRQYISGPIAHGAYTASGGASLNPDGTVRFDLLGGSYDAASGEGELEADGVVRFSGHDDGSGPLLDLTIADPRLELEGDAGTLRADVTSRSLAGGQLEQFPDVALASLDLSTAGPAPLSGGLAFDSIAASLTATGAPAFAAFYPSGTALDPMAVEALFGTRRGQDSEPQPEFPRRLDPQPPASTTPPPAAATQLFAKPKPKAKKCAPRRKRAKVRGKVKCVKVKPKRKARRRI